MDLEKFTISKHEKVSLKKFDTAYTGAFKDKESAQDALKKAKKTLYGLQDLLYAQNKYAVLVIFQAMDAAGKDGAIKHIMSGINPLGVHVTNFKQPSEEELDHDYLWRTMKALPERGRIGIFNRSYYEEVLIPKVRADILAKQKLPPDCLGKDIWEQRFEDIRNMEKYLVRNGVIVLKFYLHVSKKEQKVRFLARIEDSAKNWKFSPADLETRARWEKFIEAYEEMLGETSTKWAPWHVIPADHKWFTRVAVAQIITERLESLKLSYPKLTKAQKAALPKYKKMLENEK